MNTTEYTTAPFSSTDSGNQLKKAKLFSYSLPRLAHPNSCTLISSLVKRREVFVCGLVSITIEQEKILRYKNIQASVTHSPSILKLILKKTFPGEQ